MQTVVESRSRSQPGNIELKQHKIQLTWICFSSRSLKNDDGCIWRTTPKVLLQCSSTKKNISCPLVHTRPWHKWINLWGIDTFTHFLKLLTKNNAEGACPKCHSCTKQNGYLLLETYHASMTRPRIGHKVQTRRSYIPAVVDELSGPSCQL